MDNLIDRKVLLREMEKLYNERAVEATMTGNRACCVTWNDAVYLVTIAPAIEDEKVLRREAKKHGYILMPDKKREKFLPCTCGANRRDHWYMYDPKKGETVTLKCQKCGKEVSGSSDADAKHNWNEEMRKCSQENS